jgi:dipeptidyl aminopeptidase/acylaminoacyl peptidase
MTRVLDTTGSVLYSPPGYLLTVRDATLLAYPFDEDALRITGEPLSVAETVGGTSTQRGNFSVSSTGVLAHSRGLPTLGQLTWFARDGRVQGTVLEVGDFASIRLSQDETRLAVSIVDVATYTPDVWLVDLTRGVRTRFTFDPGSDVFPVWSPDGSQIVFRSDRIGGNNLFEKPTNGATAEKLLTALDVAYPTDWSRDGRFIAFHTSLSSSSYDVALLPRGADPKPIPVAASSFSEMGARFSPDGRLVAYASDESGRPEVYVQQLPGTGARWQVSVNGGAEPQWRGDGRELFYLAPDRRLMAATIALSPFTVASTRALFETHVSTPIGNPNRTNYEATHDGQRFLVNEGTPGAPGSITVVLNWTAAIKK